MFISFHALVKSSNFFDCQFDVFVVKVFLIHDFSSLILTQLELVFIFKFPKFLVSKTFWVLSFVKSIVDVDLDKNPLNPEY